MKKVSMKGLLIFGMPGLIIAVAIGLVLTTHFSTKKVFARHAGNIMQNVTSFTIDKARSHLEPARDAALLTGALAVNNIVTSSEVSEMESYFFEQLLINSQFSNIYYGSVNGEFIMASRSGNERFISKIISQEQGVRNVHFKELDQAFSLLREYDNPGDDYDPRKRPWFRKALEQRELVWTNPYIFYTSRSPGITTASPVYDNQGNLLGVVGVDIEISDLSDFFSSLKVGNSGKAFILDNTGQVIAYPDKSKITHTIGQSNTLELVTIANLEDDISKAAYNTLSSLEYDFSNEDDLFFTFSFEGENYYAMFSHFSVSYWPWLMGVYIPQDDFMGQLKDNRNFCIAMIILLAAVSGFIGFLITRSILRSLENLRQAAHQVGQGNLQSQIAIGTGYSELDETAAVFEYMRNSLEEYSSHMEFMVRKRTEELEKKNQELGDEILQRKKAEKELIYARNRADESRQIAESANKAKNTFLANISHEIRTPLSGIIGYTELMNQENSPEVNNKFRETILKESERLIALINRLLDISKIESGQVIVENKPFALMSVLEAAWGDISSKLVEKGLDKVIDIAPEVPERLVGDSQLLTQILTNLLSNSVKFTHQGSIAMKITAGEGADGTVELFFSVVDTGIGIPEEKMGDIFQMFFQGDNSISRNYGGFGLGLSIVKELSELMGGKVSVRSSRYKGATFVVSLPFQRFEEGGFSENSQEGMTSQNDSFRGLKVLLAEDYKVNRDLIRYHLAGTECQLLTAHNGSEAIELFEREKPDIILMDIQMPGMDGLEATRIIRKQPEGQQVCIIGVTANAFPQDLKTYWKIGMNDCLVKPFKRKDLFDKLKHWEKFSRMSLQGEQVEDLNYSVIFDEQTLMDVVEGNREMAASILEGFRFESQKFFLQFNELEKKGAFEEIHRLAHSMKSGALNVGGFRLAEAAKKLEMAALDSESLFIRELLEQLHGEFLIWMGEQRKWEEMHSQIGTGRESGK